VAIVTAAAIAAASRVASGTSATYDLITVAEVELPAHARQLLPLRP
jgi:hypothetical protein